jgi:predicted nucleotidyltransferase component of viral defense system
MRSQDVPAEMEQSLTKEFVHLHILSALSDVGLLEHVVFQGGTAIRLCHGGERYSEDLDFVCGAKGSYLDAVDFDRLVGVGLEKTRDTLARQFGLGTEAIGLKSPDDPAAIRGGDVHVAAWQLVVPLEATQRSPRSRIKVEFANVPSYDNGPRVVRSSVRTAQVQPVYLRVQSAREILADKAVALTARAALKHRDVWDVWFLQDALKATLDVDLVARKFGDYGTPDVESKASARVDELCTPAAADGFLAEMRRFLPWREVERMERFGLHRSMLEGSAGLLREVLAAPPPSPA